MENAGPSLLGANIHVFTDKAHMGPIESFLLKTNRFGVNNLFLEASPLMKFLSSSPEAWKLYKMTR